MRIGVRLSIERLGRGERAQILQFASDLESAGADIVWVPEAYSNDAVSVVATVLERTTSLLVGTGILPIYTRTPALIAQTGATLDLLGEGRFILGLGTSGPQVVEGWHGVAFDSPVKRTQEVIEICRKVWRREVLTNDGLYQIPLVDETTTGEGKPLKLVMKAHNEKIPIYVASLGPRNVEMTAELAEGWLPATLFVPEFADSVWGEALKKGLAKRSPDLPPLEIATGGPVAIGDDMSAVRDEWMPWLAMHLGGYGTRKHNFYNAILAQYGYKAEAKAIQDAYLSGDKVGAEAHIPKDFIDRISLIGPTGHVKERIAAYAEAGVTILNVLPTGPDPLKSVEKLRALL